jgi:hypothetical protein
MHAGITVITELAVEAKLPHRKRESQHCALSGKALNEN